jgi:hypothetical protein
MNRLHLLTNVYARLYPTHAHFEITHMTSYHCYDNVSMKWNKGIQTFLNVIN